MPYEFWNFDLSHVGELEEDEKKEVVYEVPIEAAIYEVPTEAAVYEMPVSSLSVSVVKAEGVLHE